MKLFGSQLARETVKNAQTAGQCLWESGLKVLGEPKGFTRSHQLAVDVQKYGGGGKVAQRLEEAHIIVNKNILPYDDQNNRQNPSGIRLGFQDVTRRGFGQGEVKHLCELMVNVIKGRREPADVRREVIELASDFSEVKYGFNSVEEALKQLGKP
jgi:glycine hydroxymethyltransferase